MTDLQLIVDLHKSARRQGPGGEAETRLAIALTRLKPDPELRIADIGSGTGASSLLLAQELRAQVTAVDFIPEFLERLQADAILAGLGDQVETHLGSMTSLPFQPGELDAIWSEGAIYNMGFEAGVADWRRYLKPGGVLAVSELTWLTAARPAEVQDHWEAVYSGVDTAGAKIAVLERQGYAPLGYFPLPEACWTANYYEPMIARFPTFLQAHDHAPDALALVEAERQEIALYERYSAYFGYGFFIARKV